jgi:hypothetical protein
MIRWFTRARPIRYGVDVMEDNLTAPQVRTLTNMIRSNKDIGFVVDEKGFVYLQNPSPLHPVDSVCGGQPKYSPLAQIMDTVLQARFVVLNTQLKCLGRYHSTLREIYCQAV